MPKMYFAEFTDSESNNVFQKFGHTGHNDAMIRLNRIVEEYPKFKVRVLAAAYHNDLIKVQGAEEAFKVMFPKNFWLDEKISGITEGVKLECARRHALIQKGMEFKNRFKKECFGD